MRDSPGLPAIVHRRVDGLASLLGVAPPAGAVLSVPMPSPRAAVAAAAACAERGLRVGCFRPPSVPDGVARLRVTAGAGVTDADWEHACRVLLDVVKECR